VKSWFSEDEGIKDEIGEEPKDDSLDRYFYTTRKHEHQRQRQEKQHAVVGLAHRKQRGKANGYHQTKQEEQRGHKPLVEALLGLVQSDGTGQAKASEHEDEIVDRIVNQAGGEV